MVQVVLGLTENSVLMYGKGFNPRLPKFMNADMNPLGRKETKRFLNKSEFILGDQSMHVSLLM